MGVAEDALSVTETVSPVLNAIVFAESQMLSADWALTFSTMARVQTIARLNAVRDFMNTPNYGRTKRCARIYIDDLIPTPLGQFLDSCWQGLQGPER